MRDNLVFIDANVFLNCYKRRYESHRRILQGLSDLGDIFFVTKVIKDEFNRNRLRAYITENKSAKLKISDGFELKTHYPAGDTDLAKYRKINSQIKKLLKEATELSEKISRNNINSILRGDDDVSLAVKILFDKCSSASEKQISAARMRKEMGNPPGKASDVLGDQLSWEQLLDEVATTRTLWIITEDSDFGIADDDTHFLLNPYLREEITNRNKNCEVHCFRDLVRFLEEIRLTGAAATKLAYLAGDIKKAKIERRDAIDKAQPQQSFIFRGAPTPCKMSVDGAHDFSDVASAHPSSFGGWSYWVHCKKCGLRFDTGEPYDD